MFVKNGDVEWQVIDANSKRKVLIMNDNLMYVEVLFLKEQRNKRIETHQHVHEQMTYILEGKFLFEYSSNDLRYKEIVEVGDTIFFRVILFMDVYLYLTILGC